MRLQSKTLYLFLCSLYPARLRHLYTRVKSKTLVEWRDHFKSLQTISSCAYVSYMCRTQRIVFLMLTTKFYSLFRSLSQLRSVHMLYHCNSHSPTFPRRPRCA
jgi:hypothetical protein